MFQEVELKEGITLDEYAENALLTNPVAELRSEARLARERLKGRTLWMLNSTTRGGGVAEMLPKQVSLLRQLGIDTRWLVMSSERPEFFELTKRLHNLIHGAAVPLASASDRALYEAVAQPLADEMGPLMKPDDILVAHDPQPLGVATKLKSSVGLKVVWRCHIGLEQDTPSTDSAWAFLKPYLDGIDHSVFSSAAYIPNFLAKRVSVISPAIDPFTHKNRDLHPVKLAGVLANAGLIPTSAPVLTPPFDALATRLTQDGKFLPLDGANNIGIMFRPTVTQVSRWDRLKGWLPLLSGFVRMKQNQRAGRYALDERGQRRLEIVRLVLAGPEPDSVQDDPEAQEVLDEIIAQYRKLSPELMQDVAVLSLPMRSPKENALMVNALQRCSSVVAQNSIQEGFGLVVTEAMWKRTPVLGSTAHGIRQQIRDGVDGILTANPEDPAAVAESMLEILRDPNRRAKWARSAQRRVYDEFLVFRQLGRWLRLLNTLARPD